MTVFIRQYLSVDNVGRIILKDVKTLVITKGKEISSINDSAPYAYLFEILYSNDTGVHKISDAIDVEVV